MKTILCYGDSNTWGCNPENGNRLDHKTRWPMALGIILNRNSPPDDPEWWVVEEGQGGRTSCREDPVEGDKNGLRQLIPILESHNPIDIVAVMLGTNDLKPRFNPTAYDIARGVQEVAKAVQKSGAGPNGASPKVLMICPPATAESPALKHLFGNSVELSRKLPPLYRALAFECGAVFLDAGKHIVSSAIDGVHFDAENHLKLAEAVAQTIKEMAKT
uniref:Lipolytic enzyme, G-D-S-L n=1 Tax=uncultured bacterium contig00076 TaxID=1181554 RepID=A0A806KKC9_9BACT|nr:lipolytic enzyme, G-D-S-L [uncultured bacterium contig00076]